MSDFTVECYKKCLDLTVEFSGDFTMTSVFPEIDVKTDEKIILRLQNAGNINSSGVKQWITWIQQLQVRASNLHFIIYSLPYSFVRLNFQVMHFLPMNRKIISFVAPYFCPHCDSSFKIEFVREKNWDMNWSSADLIQNIAKTQCCKCDNIADLDAVPNVFASLI